MPQRPKSHVVADRAVNAVADIFTRLGWACETIHQDYGEDLLIQPTTEGTVAHFRLFVQVKGTTDLEQFRNKQSGRYHFRVSAAHALRWVRSQDIVVIIIWDVERNKGVFCLPLGAADDWDIQMSSAKSVVLRFDRESIFDARGARHLYRIALLRHYTRLMESDSIRLKIAEEHNRSADAKSKAPMYALEILNEVGGIITDECGVTQEFWKRIRRCSKRFASTRVDDEPAPIEMAIDFLLLAELVGDFNVPISSMVWGTCGSFLRFVLSRQGLYAFDESDEGDPATAATKKAAKKATKKAAKKATKKAAKKATKKAAKKAAKEATKKAVKKMH